MILSALAAYYDRTVGTPGGPPPLGYAELPVVGALNIDEAGRLVEITPLSTQANVGKKTRQVPLRLVVPQPPKRTVAVEAAFLFDNAGYLLGFDAKDRPERVREQFAASRTFHARLLSEVDDPVARAILAFFANWQPAEAAVRLAGEPEEIATGWLVFRYAATGEYAHEVPALRAAWERHVAEADGPRGQCLLTGAADLPIALTHPAIKGVLGAQSSGAALVSFNQDSFTSYGKTQNLNAPIGATAAFAYTTALNHLMRPGSRQRLQLGDATVVVWAEKTTRAQQVVASAAEQVLASLLGGRSEDAELAARVQDRLQSIAAGRWVDDPQLAETRDLRFFVLGLAPNAARLQLRFFLVDTLGRLLERLQEHCRDLLFEEPGPGVYVPTLWRIASETLPKDAEGRPRSDAGAKKSLNKLHGDLFRAVLAGYDYPQSLLPLLLERLRSDGHYTTVRLGLIKAALNRHRRHSGETIGSEIDMGLDESISEPGYLLGRLFALLENLQEWSRGKGPKGESAQPTILHRFAAAASVTPHAVFPYLLSLKIAHERKAKRDAPGIAHKRTKEIEDLMNRVTAREGFPSQLDLRQQGLFFIGYYQQRRAFFAKRETGGDAESETTIEAETADTANEE